MKCYPHSGYEVRMPGVKVMFTSRRVSRASLGSPHGLLGVGLAALSSASG